MTTKPSNQGQCVIVTLVEDPAWGAVLHSYLEGVLFPYEGQVRVETASTAAAVLDAVGRAAAEVRLGVVTDAVLLQDPDGRSGAWLARQCLTARPACELLLVSALPPDPFTVGALRGAVLWRHEWPHKAAEELRAFVRRLLRPQQGRRQG